MQFGSVAGASWIYGMICLLRVWFGWKTLPEIKGRTVEKIAASWRKK